VDLFDGKVIDFASFPDYPSSSSGTPQYGAADIVSHWPAFFLVRIRGQSRFCFGPPPGNLSGVESAPAFALERTIMATL